MLRPPRAGALPGPHPESRGAAVVIKLGLLKQTQIETSDFGRLQLLVKFALALKETVRGWCFKGADTQINAFRRPLQRPRRPRRPRRLG